MESYERELFFPALKEAAIKLAKERNEPVSIDDPAVKEIFQQEVAEYEAWLESQYTPEEIILDMTE